MEVVSDRGSNEGIDRLSGGECHKSGSDLNSLSKRAPIGTKFGPKIKLIMRKLWHEFGVNSV